MRKLLLNESQLDRIVGRWRRSVLGGAVLLALPFCLPREWKGWGFGLTGFMILSGGIYTAWLRRWRTEPGLWMAALFLLISLGGSLGYFEYLYWHNLFERAGGIATRPLTPQEIGFLLDCGLALILFERMVRFFASVVVANRDRTRPKPKAAAALDWEDEPGFASG